MLNWVLWEDGLFLTQCNKTEANSGSLSGAGDRSVSWVLSEMIYGTSIYHIELWVDVSCCFILLCRMGEGVSSASEGRRWLALLCIWLRLPQRGVFLERQRGQAEEGAQELFGRWEQRSMLLLPQGLGWVSEDLTSGRNSSRRRRQGNHTPVIDSLSFLQPIPSNNHIWKYGFQASFAMVSKNALTSVETYFACPIFLQLWLHHWHKLGLP